MSEIYGDTEPNLEMSKLPPCCVCGQPAPLIKDGLSYCATHHPRD